MIKIKKAELISIGKRFDTIKLNKVSNTDVRKTILKIVLESKRISENIQKDVDTTRERFFSEFSMEDLNKFQTKLDAVKTLYQTGKGKEFVENVDAIAKEFPEINDAYNKFMMEVNALHEEEIDINIDKINIDVFVDALCEQDVDVTPSYLETLSSILENDVEN